MVKVKKLFKKGLSVLALVLVGASMVPSQSGAVPVEKRARKVLILKSDASGTFVSSSPVRLKMVMIGSAAVNSADFVVCFDTGTPASNTATHNYNPLLVAPALFATTTNINNSNMNQNVSVLNLDVDTNSGLVCRLSNVATPAFVYVMPQ